MFKSFRKRSNQRRKRFQQIEKLQNFLLSSSIRENFFQQLSFRIFSQVELDDLSQIDLVPKEILEHFPFEDRTRNSSNFLSHFHVLDPIIDKYSRLLTTIILELVSKFDRLSSINESLLMNFDEFFTVDELLQICRDEKLVVDQENFDKESNSVVEHQRMLTIFDHLLHFNHRTMIEQELKRLIETFKPTSIFKAQILVEKETKIIDILIKARRHYRLFTERDLHRYLEFYPIPCRL